MKFLLFPMLYLMSGIGRALLMEGRRQVEGDVNVPPLVAQRKWTLFIFVAPLMPLFVGLAMRKKAPLFWFATRWAIAAWIIFFPLNYYMGAAIGLALVSWWIAAVDNS
jgi:dolichol kinase